MSATAELTPAGDTCTPMDGEALFLTAVFSVLDLPLLDTDETIMPLCFGSIARPGRDAAAALSTDGRFLAAVTGKGTDAVYGTAGNIKGGGAASSLASVEGVTCLSLLICGWMQQASANTAGSTGVLKPPAADTTGFALAVV